MITPVQSPKGYYMNYRREYTRCYSIGIPLYAGLYTWFPFIPEYPGDDFVVFQAFHEN